jgi:hypothetical protein
VRDFEHMNLRPSLFKDEHQTTTDDAEAKPGDTTRFVGLQSPKPPRATTRRLRRLGLLFIALMNNVVQLIFAMAVGAALITPMLIMVLHPSRNTSLITTCVFVFAFACAMVIYNNVVLIVDYGLRRIGMVGEGLVTLALQPKDIMGATAAYAAVLVVFVGTSTRTSSQD